MSVASEGPPAQQDGPPFTVSRDAAAVLETLWSNGHAAYLVGGCVRDSLLGLPVTDWDVATDARPERILRIFPGAIYENRFGTVLARGLEITTFRREHRYADHRRPDSITFSDDVYEDLARRDLTINAIAWGRRDVTFAGRMVDPADGQGDLRARLVRAVGDPARRFDEDALRLLRAVRIAARLDFTIEPVTRAAMAAHAADVTWVSEERIGSEVRRMLIGARPVAAFGLLHETGLLAVLLPELADPSPALATLAAIEARAPGQERLAWAALLGHVDEEAARGALERLRVGSRDREAVTALAAGAAVRCLPTWTDADVRRFMGGIPPELLDELLLLRAARAEAFAMDAGHADAPGCEAAFQARVLAQRDAAAPLALSQLAISGRDLQETLGIAEGPAIGIILAQLLVDVVEDPSLNHRVTLLARAGMVLDELAQGGRDGSDRTRME